MALAPSLRSLLERPDAARRLGAFVLVHQLGSGGFAPVWLARELYGDIEIRRAAIKLFAFDRDDKAGSVEARDRVMEEARLLCRVEHPNIVRFYSLLEDHVSGVIGLVMEYVEGASLERRLRVRKRLPVHETLAIGAVIASALSAIHRAGLVHRDVKPANVIESGGSHKLIDFGVASSGRGAQGFVPAGTNGYIDPVCVATGVPATPSSDLYSLGAMLFECLTGKLPSVLAAGAAGGMSIDVVEGRAAAPQVAEHASDLPPALAALIDSLLSPRRERRPASAEGVVTRLERIRAERQGRKVELPPETVGPFRGLGRFEESDRDVYFGRSAEVAATMDLLRRRGLVTLAGASGTGKSSLARAGVAPQVAEGALGGWIKKWDVVLTAPGPRPRDAITSALAPLVPNAAELDPDHLAEEMARGAETRGRGTLLVVDQLEELVTVAEPEEASWLATLLARVADPPHPFVRALGATRRDLLDPLLALGRLGAVLPRSLLVVGPMSGSDWANAIDQALSAYGYSFEDSALRDELLAEIESRATAMPLVQFALSELWKHRDPRRKIIPRKGLAAIGGLSGALERHAETTLRNILAETSLPLTAVREVMLVMTTPQGTRAARSQEDLEFLMGPDVRSLIAKLESARLLVREDDGITLAHDTLLTQWWRLRDWITTARDDRFLGEDVERDAARWAKEGEDPSLLWTKRRLAAAADLLRVGLVKLSPLAERFVLRSKRMERRGRAGLATFAALGLAAAAVAGGMYAQKNSGNETAMLEQRQEVAELREQVAQQERRQCEEAARLRSRAERTLSQGRLSRTLRIVEKANRACPSTAADSQKIEAEALAELRPTTPAATSDATALVKAGQAARALGQAAQAARFFDRAVAILEEREKSQLTVEPPMEFDGTVRAVEWSVDGSELTVVHGAAVSTLNGASGEEMSRIRLDSDVIALSPGGDGIACETADHGVRILDVRSGAPVGSLPSKPGNITVLAMSRKRPRVVVVRADNTVGVWSLSGTAQLLEMKPESGRITAVAISEDGRLFALGMSDGGVDVHETSTGKRLVAFGKQSADKVRSVAFSPDGEMVAWGADDATGWLAKVAVDSSPTQIGMRSTAVRSVQFSPDGKYVYTAAANAVAQWSMAGVAQRVVPAGAGVHSIAISPKEQIAAASDGAPIMLTDGNGSKQIGNDFATTRALAFSTGGDVLMMALDDQTLRAWSVARGNFLRIVREPPGDAPPVPAAIAGSVDGRLLISATGGKAVRVWSLLTGEYVPIASPDPLGTIAASFATDGEHALTVSGDGKLHVWTPARAEGITIPKEASAAVLAASFRPEGKQIVTVMGDGTRRLWDAETGQLVQTFGGDEEKKDGDRLKVAVLSPDLRQFVTWRHNVLELFDTETGALVHKLAGHGDAPVRAAAFSSDARRLFTGGGDRTVRVWDTASGALLSTVEGYDRAIGALAVAPGGALVAATLDDGAVRLFHEGSRGRSATIRTLVARTDEEGALVTSSDGHVDFVGATACALKEKVSCRVGSVRLPFEVCEDRFYVAGLLPLLASGDTTYEEPETERHPLECPSSAAPPRGP